MIRYPHERPPSALPLALFLALVSTSSLQVLPLLSGRVRKKNQQLQGRCQPAALPAACSVPGQMGAEPTKEARFRAGEEAPVLSSPGPQRALASRGSALYGELWFVALVALLALLFLAIALSLLLQRRLRREPHIRERLPLGPPQKRAPSLGGYPAGAAPMFDSVADISDVASSVTLKSYTLHLEGLASARTARAGTPGSLRSAQSLSVLRALSQPPVRDRCSPPGTLSRSISQFLDMQDPKEPVDGCLWEAILGPDSGLYVDEEDLMKAIQGFSSVTKEHTTFTDTQL